MDFQRLPPTVGVQGEHENGEEKLRGAQGDHEVHAHGCDVVVETVGVGRDRAAVDFVFILCPAEAAIADRVGEALVEVS